MLTLENILKLADLGFTKDEIMKFNGETPEALAGEVKEAKDEPAQRKVEPVPEPAVVTAENTELIDAIKDLKKAIQASNIATTPQPAEPTTQEKADEVLMKLINM